MLNIMDDIEFEYISEDEVLEDSALNEDFEPRFFDLITMEKFLWKRF